MQIDDLSYFLEVASGSTFLEAAENLHCSQSVVSKSIHRLEKELDISLFYRDKRKAALTPAGIALRMSLLEIKPLYENMLRSVKAYASGTDIRFYIEPDPYALNLSYYIRLFNVEYPDINIIPASPNLQNYTMTPESIFHDGSYAFWITHKSMAPAEGYRSFLLQEDHFVALFSREFPNQLLTDPTRTELSLRELNDQIFISTEPGQWCECVRERFCNEYDIHPSAVVRQTRHREKILFNLSMYGGLALFYASDLRAFNLENYAVVKITDIPPDPYVLIQCEAAAPKEETTLFIAFCKKHFHAPCQ